MRTGFGNKKCLNEQSIHLLAEAIVDSVGNFKKDVLKTLFDA